MGAGRGGEATSMPPPSAAAAPSERDLPFSSMSAKLSKNSTSLFGVFDDIVATLSVSEATECSQM